MWPYRPSLCQQSLNLYFNLKLRIFPLYLSSWVYTAISTMLFFNWIYHNWIILVVNSSWHFQYLLNKWVNEDHTENLELFLILFYFHSIPFSPSLFYHYFIPFNDCTITLLTSFHLHPSSSRHCYLLPGLLIPSPVPSHTYQQRVIEILF